MWGDYEWVIHIPLQHTATHCSTLQHTTAHSLHLHVALRMSHYIHTCAEWVIESFTCDSNCHAPRIWVTCEWLNTNELLHPYVRRMRHWVIHMWHKLPRASHECEPCHIYEWGMSHIWISHVTHESFHPYVCGMSHSHLTHSDMCIHMCVDWMEWLSSSMCVSNDSFRHTYMKWLIPHTNESHIWNDSFHTQISHSVTLMERLIPHTNESFCHTYHSVTLICNDSFHTQMSHTYEMTHSTHK